MSLRAGQTLPSAGLKPGANMATVHNVQSRAATLPWSKRKRLPSGLSADEEEDAGWQRSTPAQCGNMREASLGRQARLGETIVRPTFLDGPRPARPVTM